MFSNRLYILSAVVFYWRCNIVFILIHFLLYEALFCDGFFFHGKQEINSYTFFSLRWARGHAIFSPNSLISSLNMLMFLAIKLCFQDN